MFIIPHGCRGHGTILTSTHCNFWVLMSAQECPWALIGAQECSWHHAHAYSGILMSIHGYSWALISSHERSWAWRYSAMPPTVLMSDNERSWAWRHGAIFTHSVLAQYLSVLMSHHKLSWVLLSAPEYSWIILSVQVVESAINKKTLIFKMTSL